MRLIDADELFEYVERPNIYDINVTDFQNIVDEQQTIEQSQWIPCRERLPLEEGVYIVSCVNHNHNGREFVSGDYFYTSESNTEGGFFDAFGADVIAWQPLPKPYKEETK